MCYFLADLVTSFDSKRLLWESLDVSLLLEAFTPQAEEEEEEEVFWLIVYITHEELVCCKGADFNSGAICYNAARLCDFLPPFISRCDTLCHFCSVSPGAALLFLFSLTPFAA